MAKEDNKLMTLDEAIKHCSETASSCALNNKMECAWEHKQLCDWLTELRERRNLDEKKYENITDDEIRKFILSHHSNGNISVMVACNYIQVLLDKLENQTK